jgi:integrase/recombinase XerC
VNHFTAFQDYLSYEKKYSILTVQAYTQDLEQFFAFIQSEFRLDSINLAKHPHIRTWLAQLKENKISSRTINRKISTLKSYYKYLLRNNIIKELPTTKLISPKSAKKLPSYVSDSQMLNVLQIVSEAETFSQFTNKLIIELLYTCGLRRAELANLTVANTNIAAHTIKVLGKGNKERILPLASSTLALIKTYLQQRSDYNPITDYLLILDNGKPLYHKYIYNVVRKYLTLGSTQDKKSPHALRHTFATQLLNNGAQLNAVKDLLGHASLAATQVYTHNTIDKLKSVFKKAHPKA